MKLYSYWRSTTSYRVRIALHMKGIAHEIVPVNLINDEQSGPDYMVVNPVKGVPSLVLADGRVLTQSMAILRYLDKVYPRPSLWSEDWFEGARIEAAALVIASDIHPINNLKVIQQLKMLGHERREVVIWINHWIREGLVAFINLIGEGAFCFGDIPSLADLCLIPQLYNARRWGTDLKGLERLTDIETNCLTLDAFQQAHPDNQVDSVM